MEPASPPPPKVGKLWAKIVHTLSCTAFQHEPATQIFLQLIAAKFSSFIPKKRDKPKSLNPQTGQFCNMPFESGVMIYIWTT